LLRAHSKIRKLIIEDELEVNLTVPKVPEKLLESLDGVAGFNRKAFEDVHSNGQQITSIRFNPSKPSADLVLPADEFRIPWTSHGYYLPERPSFTLDPFLHAGLYYVQEASSMFLEQALRQTTDLSQPLKVLDLCAAPGGKSTLIQSLVSPDSIVVSNEVIKSRASILEEIITKWGAANVIVTNNDPASFQRLESYFDVIIIDAPCSGSGLFRKDPRAITEWSESNVELCSQRQQRILADVYPALKRDGILIYSTCSYSEEEDECISDWLLDSFAVSSLQLTMTNDTGPENRGIVETISKKHASFGYRFFPDRIKGEGLFMACFRKLYGGEYKYRQPRKMKLAKVSRNEEAIIRPWLNKEAAIQLWKQGDLIFAFPLLLEKELLALVSADLYIRKAGVAIGSLAGQELIPEHALALSGLINREIGIVQLNKEEALQYLRKEEVKITSPHKGWTLVQYEGMNLGWIKILANRSNNYYPKEWRILKSGNE
jgi:16S rRNA C967 or C1407 C5-methylase (RsmB/RsmF family)/NOL1/NOP2/fmu family ribosome biogenesis protein